MRATGGRAEFFPFDACSLGNKRSDSKKTLRSIFGGKDFTKDVSDFE